MVRHYQRLSSPTSLPLGLSLTHTPPLHVSLSFTATPPFAPVPRPTATAAWHCQQLWWGKAVGTGNCQGLSHGSKQRRDEKTRRREDEKTRRLGGGGGMLLFMRNFYVT